ncbi:MAG: FAD-dependent oxidoreductase [Dehalococcoidia bacterium]|nr:FAD-dependent oxidoreductase [Dehalococcoidia bacterium]
MAKVIVVGGGMAGCAAALSAAQAGAQTILLERTDMLLGGGIRAGRMDFEGKLTAAQEAKALGCGQFFEALESIILHRTNIIGEKHGYVYDTTIAEPTVKDLVQRTGVEVRLVSRAVDVRKKDGHIQSVELEDGSLVEGGAFIDASGSAGGVDICTRYGDGCAMCVFFRCPTFGDRVSIATKAGAPELMRRRPDGTPGTVTFAGTQFILKETLAPKLRAELEEKGVVRIPLPPELIDYDLLEKMGPVRTREQVEGLNLVNIGSVAKCVPPVLSSPEMMRSFPGLEKAQFEGAGKYGMVKYITMTPRDNSLRVDGFANLFVAGEKAGPSSGLAEAMVLGHLAGHNAVRTLAGKKPLILPRTLGIGDFVAYLDERMRNDPVIYRSYSMGSGVYFERMRELGLYTTNMDETRGRVERAGLIGIMAQKVI